MATSKFETLQYSAEHFVESAGAVLFNVSTRQICLVHEQKKDEWLLAKGRRNVGESRHVTAVREAEEETGLKCRLLPLTMTTRAPPTVETEQHYPDEPRLHHGVCEPFMVTHRRLKGAANIKIIWWFIAAINENEATGAGETQFKAKLFGFDDALSMLKYELDRDIVRKAIEIFDGTPSKVDALTQ